MMALIWRYFRVSFKHDFFNIAEVLTCFTCQDRDGSWIAPDLLTACQLSNECEHQNTHEFGSNKTNSYKPRCYSRESINRNQTCLRHPGHYGYVRYRLQLPVQLVGIFYFASVYARWRDVTLNSTWWIHVSRRNFTWTPYWEFLFMSAGKILEDKTGNLHRI